MKFTIRFAGYSMGDTYELALSDDNPNLEVRIRWRVRDGGPVTREDEARTVELLRAIADEFEHRLRSRP